jgi:hypothetical protein
LLPKNVNIKIHTTITLNVVLYGCETRSLTRQEEQRLRVFEIRVLRTISAPKRGRYHRNEKDHVYYEQVHNLQSSQNIV